MKKIRRREKWIAVTTLNPFVLIIGNGGRGGGGGKATGKAKLKFTLIYINLGWRWLPFFIPISNERFLAGSLHCCANDKTNAAAPEVNHHRTRGIPERWCRGGRNLSNKRIMLIRSLLLLAVHFWMENLEDHLHNNHSFVHKRHCCWLFDGWPPSAWLKISFTKSIIYANNKVINLKRTSLRAKEEFVEEEEKNVDWRWQGKQNSDTFQDFSSIEQFLLCRSSGCRSGKFLGG